MRRTQEFILPSVFEEMVHIMESQRQMIEKLMDKTHMMEQSLIDLNIKLSDIQSENRMVREEFQYNQSYRDFRSLVKEGNNMVMEKILKTHHNRYRIYGEYFM